MLAEYVVPNGEVIGYALVGVIALLGLAIVQLFRRRSDLAKARIAVRLATYSISVPRPGPIAVKGPYHQTADERWLSANGQRVDLDGPIEIVRGTRGRWKSGTRTYTVKEADEVIAIGIMSKAQSGAWRLVSSPGEAGIQIFAVEPRSAPAPLFPWRAPLIFAIWAAVAFFGLAQVGGLLADVPKIDACGESAMMKLQIASALPQTHDDAIAKLARCAK
jgi:hypothetical protein